MALNPLLAAMAAGGVGKPGLLPGVGGGGPYTLDENDPADKAIGEFANEVRDRLLKFYTEGILKRGDLDTKALQILSGLKTDLQMKVLQHMETEKMSLATSRSKSGFMVSVIEKAKQGSLDAKGFGSIDPWRQQLIAQSLPKRGLIDLVPEEAWLEECGYEAEKIVVDVSIDKEVGVPTVSMEMGLTETSASIKQRLKAMGVKLPVNKMKLKTASVGYLKDKYTLAYYNITGGQAFELCMKERGGFEHKKDFSVPPKKQSM